MQTELEQKQARIERLERDLEAMRSRRDALQNKLSDFTEELVTMAHLAGVFYRGSEADVRAIRERVQAKWHTVEAVGSKLDAVRVVWRKYHAEAATQTFRTPGGAKLIQFVNELADVIEPHAAQVVEVEPAGLRVHVPPAEPQVGKLAESTAAIHPAFLAAGKVERGEVVSVVGADGTKTERVLRDRINDAKAEVKRIRPQTAMLSRVYDILNGWSGPDVVPVEVMELRELVQRLRRENAEDRVEMHDWQKLAVKRRKAINQAIAALGRDGDGWESRCKNTASLLEKVSETDLSGERTHAELEEQVAELQKYEIAKDLVIKELRAEAADLRNTRRGHLLRVKEFDRLDGEKAARIENMEAENLTLREELDEARERISAFEKSDADLQTETVELERLVKKLRGEIDTLRLDNECVRNALAGHKGTIEDKDRQVGEQRKGLAAAVREIEVLRQTCREDRERLHGCQQALTAAQHQVAAKQGHIAALQDRITVALAKLDDADPWRAGHEAKAALMAEREAESRDLRQLRIDLQEIQARYLDYQGRCDKARAEISHATGGQKVAGLLGRVFAILDPAAPTG